MIKDLIPYQVGNFNEDNFRFAKDNLNYENSVKFRTSSIENALSDGQSTLNGLNPNFKSKYEVKITFLTENWKDDQEYIEKVLYNRKRIIFFYKDTGRALKWYYNFISLTNGLDRKYQSEDSANSKEFAINFDLLFTEFIECTDLISIYDTDVLFDDTKSYRLDYSNLDLSYFDLLDINHSQKITSFNSETIREAFIACNAANPPKTVGLIEKYIFNSPGYVSSNFLQSSDILSNSTFWVKDSALTISTGQTDEFDNQGANLLNFGTSTKIYQDVISLFNLNLPVFVSLKAATNTGTGTFNLKIISLDSTGAVLNTTTTPITATTTWNDFTISKNSFITGTKTIRIQLDNLTLSPVQVKISKFNVNIGSKSNYESGFDNLVYEMPAKNAIYSRITANKTTINTSGIDFDCNNKVYPIIRITGLELDSSLTFTNTANNTNLTIKLTTLPKRVIFLNTFTGLVYDHTGAQLSPKTFRLTSDKSFRIVFDGTQSVKQNIFVPAVVQNILVEKQQSAPLDIWVDFVKTVH
jgi:hypothetical protein